MKQEKKKTRSSVAAPERATETGTTIQKASISTYNDTMTRRGGQGKTISKLLLEGAQNGLHLRDLVRITGWTEREVRQQIHHERLAGVPILSDNSTGYYLPGNDGEKERFVRSMKNRAREIERAAEAVEHACTEGGL